MSTTTTTTTPNTDHSAAAREHFGMKGAALMAKLKAEGHTGRTLAERAAAWHAHRVEGVKQLAEALADPDVRAILADPVAAAQDLAAAFAAEPAPVEPTADTTDAVPFAADRPASVLGMCWHLNERAGTAFAPDRTPSGSPVLARVVCGRTGAAVFFQGDRFTVTTPTAVRSGRVGVVESRILAVHVWLKLSEMIPADVNPFPTVGTDDEPAAHVQRPFYPCQMCGSDIGWDAPSGVCSARCVNRAQGFTSEPAAPSTTTTDGNGR